MTATTLLTSLFRYKRSVDEELLDALASLPDERRSESYTSALRVLNHAHVVDRIFVANLQKQPHDYTASWATEVPAVHDLADAMRETDRWYLDYVARVSPDELEETVRFTFTDGARGCMSREEMLAHVLTHGAYHRGEAGRLLPELEMTTMRDVFAGYLHRSEPQRRR